MNKELVIATSGKEVEIAVLEDSKLVELHRERLGDSFNVGDIYLGQVKKTMPGLNAAFVDIGHPKDAFLHYTDCGPKLSSVAQYTQEVLSGKQNKALLDDFRFPKDIDKGGSIDQVLRKDELLMVQVLKEPISTKGPRLSCEITIPGRYIVISPFKSMVAVSKKIPSEEERNRLKHLIESIKPKNFGVIVRTAAEGVKVAELHEDMINLTQKWEHAYNKLLGAKSHKILLKELDKTESLLRDVLSDSYNRIVVNSPETHLSIKDYLQTYAKDKVKILDLYKGTRPLFDTYGVTKQIKSSFGQTHTMKSGAYLVIEHTEAMHVIDVNSGPKSKTTNQEEAALAVNLEAANEIARQLKLRDLGGIIIVDFIDMRSPENKVALVKAFKTAMSSDRAQHTILPLSKFGLMQITRQRTRPELNISTKEVCPSCDGTGKITSSLLVLDDIERELEKIIESRDSQKLNLVVHPYVNAYLSKGLWSIKNRWRLKYRNLLKVSENASFSINGFKFYDINQDEIRLT